MRAFGLRSQVAGFRARLLSVWKGVSEHHTLQTLRAALQRVRDRWLAFCFVKRFYRQVCQSEAGPLVRQEALAGDFDMTQCLFQRSLAPNLHALVQLRVAAQIACIAETAARSDACHGLGWSDEAIRAALVGSPKEGLSEPELLALRYANEVTRTPIDVDPQTIKQLRRYFNHDELVELTASIVYENFRCRFADAKSKLV